MLDIRVTIEGQKVVIEGLQKLGPKINAATRRGLERIGKGVFGQAYYWLSGPGSVFENRTSKSGKQYRKKVADYLPGGYPVPVRIGHLRGRLAWLKPGEAKSADGQTFFAFLNETVIYDSADYAEDIFEGKGTSAKYGPRDALQDGLARFNQGGRIKDILEEEIQKEL